MFYPNVPCYYPVISPIESQSNHSFHDSTRMFPFVTVVSSVEPWTIHDRLDSWPGKRERPRKIAACQHLRGQLEVLIALGLYVWSSCQTTAKQRVQELQIHTGALRMLSICRIQCGFTRSKALDKSTSSAATGVSPSNRAWIALEACCGSLKWSITTWDGCMYADTAFITAAALVPSTSLAHVLGTPAVERSRQWDQPMQLSVWNRFHVQWAIIKPLPCNSAVDTASMYIAAWKTACIGTKTN